MSTSKRSGVRVLVTGAGGFIGHHLVAFLKQQGYWVRGVDLKHPEYAPTAADEFQLLDLRRWENCLRRRGTSKKSTRWRRTWEEWASSPTITRRFSTTTF